MNKNDIQWSASLLVLLSLPVPFSLLPHLHHCLLSLESLSIWVQPQHHLKVLHRILLNWGSLSSPRSSEKQQVIKKQD